MTEDLPSQTKMEALGEGDFSVSMNTSSSAPFQEERLGLGLYTGGVHVKIQMGMLIKFFRFEIWANPVVVFFLGGWCRKLALFLGYVKASSSAPFQEEKLGLSLYPGDVM